MEALKKLVGQRRDVDLVVFGNQDDRLFADLGLPCHSVGILRDDYSLAMLYSAADVVAIPSRIDNLPQIALEAQCCGTPCVAFRVGGIPDIIEHHRTGFLAQPYSTDELAAGMNWTLNHRDGAGELADQTREIAVVKWNQEKVGHQYLELLNRLAAQGKHQ